MLTKYCLNKDRFAKWGMCVCVRVYSDQIQAIV